MYRIVYARPGAGWGRSRARSRAAAAARGSWRARPGPHPAEAARDGCRHTPRLVIRLGQSRGAAGWSRMVGTQQGCLAHQRVSHRRAGHGSPSWLSYLLLFAASLQLCSCSTPSSGSEQPRRVDVERCDCDGDKSIGALLSGSQGCLLRAVLAPQLAAVAARAVRTQLRAHPTLEVRGGSGADVASFDGGGGEKKHQGALIEDVTGDDGGTYVAFDSSAAAAGAVSAATAAVSWPAELLALQRQYLLKPTRTPLCNHYIYNTLYIHIQNLPRNLAY